MRRINLNLIIALDALLSEKHVTRAAERVHISQPGMSAALKELRAHFSDPLLARSGRHFELTPKAQQLAGPITDVLARLGEILEVNARQKSAARSYSKVDVHQAAE